MNIQQNFDILANFPITHKTWVMMLEGDTGSFHVPGQFVNIALPGKYLRRPISVCDYSENSLTLLYDVVGEGTRQMSRMRPEEKLDILVGLGNGFSIPENISNPLLLGGGIGCAPLVNLAKELKKGGKNPTVILGFNNSEDCDRIPEFFRTHDIEPVIATVDGSIGTKGFVTDAIRELNINGDYFYACGPMPMLKAISNTLEIDGELSIESRMGCGFGICMCCSVETTDGAKRICKDGPVFRKEELRWK